MTLYQFDLDKPRVRPRNGGLETSESSQLEGQGSVSITGTPPKSLDVEVTYQGPYASRRGAALEELGNAAPMMPAPFVSVSTFSGYYVVDSVERDARISLEDGKGDTDHLSLGLIQAGTIGSTWLAVTTTITQPDPGHDFGNDTSAMVGIPASASHVQAVDATSGPTERATPTPTSTVDGENGAVDLYDADAIPFANPVFIYQPESYDIVGDVDAGAWDDYGEPSKTDSGGAVQWGRIFDPAHDPRESAALVLENGLLRLTIDDDAQTLAAEAWDSGAGAWSAVSLGTSNWEPVLADLTRVAPAAVEVQVEFSDGTATYTLDLVLPRGYESAQWWIPASVEDPIPTGLHDLLEPIASAQVVDVGASVRLVSREGVRL